jgi:hypothetical protein
MLLVDGCNLRELPRTKYNRIHSTMKSHQTPALWLLIKLLLLALSIGEAKKRDELPERRKLGLNVFDAAELRKNLASQRTEYKDPFENEPRINMVPARSNNYELARHKTQTTDAGQTAVLVQGIGLEVTEVALDEIVEQQPVLDIELSGKGKGGKGKGSDGRSKGSKSSQSKSKGKGDPSIKSMKSSSMMSYTHFPTVSPTPHSGPSNPGGTNYPTPTSGLTDKPSCPPSTGFFPSDVSDFFGKPPTGDSNDLANELNNALNQIQVPAEFNQECVV